MRDVERGMHDKKCSIFDYCFAWRFTELGGGRKQRDEGREEREGKQSVGVRGIVLFKRSGTKPPLFAGALLEIEPIMVLGLTIHCNTVSRTLSTDPERNPRTS